MNSGGSGDWRSRGRREAMPKPVNQTWPVAALTRMLLGLMSLWMRPRACNWRSAADKALDRLAPGIVEHKHGLSALAHKRQRSHCPRFVQLVLQAVFVCQAIEAARRRPPSGGNHGQNSTPVTVGTLVPSSPEDTVAILPQHLEATIPADAGPR